MLGIGGDRRPDRRAGERPLVPTLAEVLDFAAGTGATIAPEIKNIPPTSQQELTGPDDFDPDPRGFATTVSKALADSGFPQERMIVQSFWPREPRGRRARSCRTAQLSFLTLAQMNDPGPELAAARQYDWISPGYGDGLNPTYVERAHLYGERVTVYTPDSCADLASAAAADVDAVITNDPDRAEDVVAGRAARRPRRPRRRARRRAARAARSRAGGRAARRSPRRRRA